MVRWNKNIRRRQGRPQMFLSLRKKLKFRKIMRKVLKQGWRRYIFKVDLIKKKVYTRHLKRLQRIKKQLSLHVVYSKLSGDRVLRSYFPILNSLGSVVSRVLTLFMGEFHRKLYLNRLEFWSHARMLYKLSKRLLRRKSINKAWIRRPKRRIFLGFSKVTRKWLRFIRPQRLRRKVWSIVYKLGIPVVRYWSEEGNDFVRLKDSNLVYQFYRQYIENIFGVNLNELWLFWLKFKRSRHDVDSIESALQKFIMFRLNKFIVYLGMSFDKQLGSELVKLGVCKVNGLVITDSSFMLSATDVFQANILFIRRFGPVFKNWLGLKMSKYWTTIKFRLLACKFVQSYWSLMLVYFLRPPLIYESFEERISARHWIKWMLRQFSRKKRFVDLSSKLKLFTMHKVRMINTIENQ